MYDMIHSAEIVHRQRAAEIARNAEYARRRAESSPQPIDPPRPRREGILARLAAYAHLARHHGPGGTALGAH